MSEQPATAVPTRRRRILLLALIAVGLYLLDLISKLIVVAELGDRPPLKLLGGVLYLTLTRNTGAAFNLGEGATILLTAVAAAVVVIILRTARNLYSTGWAISLGLILGGALGNLTDRIFRSPGIFRGGVVDFLSFFDPFGQVWPIFNFADSAIVCGGILAVLLALTGREMDGTRHRGDKRDPVGQPSAGAAPAASSIGSDNDNDRVDDRVDDNEVAADEPVVMVEPPPMVEASPAAEPSFIEPPTPPDRPGAEPGSGTDERRTHP